MTCSQQTGLAAADRCPPRPQTHMQPSHIGLLGPGRRNVCTDKLRGPLQWEQTILICTRVTNLANLCLPYYGGQPQVHRRLLSQKTSVWHVVLRPFTD